MEWPIMLFVVLVVRIIMFVTSVFCHLEPDVVRLILFIYLIVIHAVTGPICMWLVVCHGSQDDLRLFTWVWVAVTSPLPHPICVAVGICLYIYLGMGHLSSKCFCLEFYTHPHMGWRFGKHELSVQICTFHAFPSKNLFLILTPIPHLAWGFATMTFLCRSGH